MKRKTGSTRARLPAFLLAVLLTVSGLPQTAAFAASESNQLLKQAELVFFVRLKDVDEFVSGSTFEPVVTLSDGSQMNLNDWYNGAGESAYVYAPSVNQYYEKNTYGSMLIKPTFVSASKDRMASYVVNLTTAEAEKLFTEDGSTRNYEAIQKLNREVVEACKANIPADVQVDYDRNGYVDGINLIWCTNNNDFFSKVNSPHTGSNYTSSIGTNISINGARSNAATTNWVYLRKGAGGIFHKDDTVHPLSRNTYTHETLHMHLGLIDTYLSKLGVPTVESWELMGTSTRPYSLTLAQRQAVNRLRYGQSSAAFGRVKDVTASGRYTLYDVNDPQPPNGHNGLRIEIPYSAETGTKGTWTGSRYKGMELWIEYRRGETDAAAAEYGSGLLLYTAGSPDNKYDWMLYSKNPEDPEDYKSQVIANTAEGIGRPLSGAGNQALIYYDTKVDQKINTGVYIRNVSEAGESISFDLYLPESAVK